MTLTGSVGMGLVWGWLLVLIWRDVPGKRPLRHFLASLLATVLITALFIWLTDWIHWLVFAGTAVFAFMLHLAWRTRLRNEAERI
ncbi:MAG: hypothetical protein H6667_16250 [Ardenticatenaceae bacterium]|nr:hypothetical protein [Ardenticatenaceae bacterium]MCB9443614.1 hypothetical protein [Ardenticatenaceae bacterium]